MPGDWLGRPMAFGFIADFRPIVLKMALKTWRLYSYARLLDEKLVIRDFISDIMSTKCSIFVKLSQLDHHGCHRPREPDPGPERGVTRD